MPKITFDVGRPTNVERAIADWAYQVALDMQLSQQELDFVATGDSLEEYEVRVSKPNTVELLMADYMEFNIRGRGPGGFPPLNEIIKWLQVKGIKPEGKQTLQGLAFLIGRKLAAEGNAVYRGQRKGIPMQEIIERSFTETTMGDAATKIAIQAANDILISTTLPPNRR